LPSEKRRTGKERFGRREQRTNPGRCGLGHFWGNRGGKGPSWARFKGRKYQRGMVGEGEKNGGGEKLDKNINRFWPATTRRNFLSLKKWEVERVNILERLRQGSG